MHSIPKWLRSLLLTLSVLSVLGYAFSYTVGKERIRRDGTLHLFALRPVDPRSLLQGDYLRLDYRILSEANRNTDLNEGFLVFTVVDGVAEFVRLQAATTPLSTGQHVIKFWRRNAGAGQVGSVRIGSPSYFFEEGQARRFSTAAYGGYYVDDRGNALLDGLYDRDFVRL